MKLPISPRPPPMRHPLGVDVPTQAMPLGSKRPPRTVARKKRSGWGHPCLNRPSPHSGAQYNRRGDVHHLSQMKIAIVSDIHGNLAAFTPVLRDLHSQDADQVLVGGDLVLGGRQPTEVLDLLLETGWPAVLGNTDAFVLKVADGIADHSDPDYPMAAWAAERLGPRHLVYLRALPLLLRRHLPNNRELVLVHATPWNLTDIVLPDAPDDLAHRMLREGQAEAVAYGHIHSPYCRTIDDGLLASVGGVAWSNDEDARPAYSIVAVDRDISVEVRRVPYDAEAELGAIDLSGLPLSDIVRRLLRSGGTLGRLKA
jgi:predicted phosphodiesterase